MANEAHDTKKLAKILDHPVRQRIIELLGTGGPMSWKSLSSELGIGTGALYYHVDMLEGLVARDAQKRFALTKAGTDIFTHLQGHPVTDPLPRVSLSSSYAPGQKLLSMVFLPRSAINRITSTSRRALVTLGVLSALFLAASLYFGDTLNLFFLTPVSGSISVAVGYLLSLASMFGISYLATRFFFGVNPSILVLAAACAFSLIPVFAFMSVSTLLNHLMGFSPGRNLFTVLVVFFQSWSAGLLGAGISVSSGLRIEKTLLLSLAILYATMVVLFVQGTIVV